MLIVTARAYAKLNLTLEVVGRRRDGYHDLRSLVAAVDWHDDVRASLTDVPGVDVKCDQAALANRDNLVYLAAHGLAGWYGLPACGTGFQPVISPAGSRCHRMPVPQSIAFGPPNLPRRSEARNEIPSV